MRSPSPPPPPPPPTPPPSVPPPPPQVATLRSAVKLEQEQQFLIAKKLQELTGSKNIKLKPVVDADLVAGFVVEYGSTQIDLSGARRVQQHVSGEGQGAGGCLFQCGYVWGCFNATAAATDLATPQTASNRPCCCCHRCCSQAPAGEDQRRPAVHRQGHVGRPASLTLPAATFSLQQPQPQQAPSLPHSLPHSSLPRFVPARPAARCICIF